ncbi:ribonuclease HII [Roseobacter sp. HKCCD9010]|uniref:ribonuclease HII n=1 Tax=unclassified Roseobacter TaxID=196798 RepID=UPI001491B86D|nr:MULTISPECIES: ribonuclease HII [unclassified Roseobacter]MBF9048552.1 ribonuclease HII [Rhodobacterales bacterium HKCCD4356]NNV10551.1 ribonuclease HII [Roseobacter sp. HKCCD7357]NNV14736.1 ribonuclease HII [Roseobacter sp. HKCCD8768]NNV24195.1 ribonuclease HII [Roseobacter sp. HKCCD8192]NNV28452.1 ribonuclease HII [Roseobacter sp. HKCCD9061]
MQDGPDFSHEQALGGIVAGVDEVGRGPLAGPVTAAAVVLDPGAIPEGLNDSKKVPQAKREVLFDALHQVAQVSIGWADIDEIDALNIRGASLLAMRRAVEGLPRLPSHALIDGNTVPPDMPCAATTLIKGDARSLSIAAASIVAKVARDRVMVALAQQHPGYGWERNAGYGTAEHLAALRDLGVTPAHRRSFKPVHNILYQANN